MAKRLSVILVLLGSVVGAALLLAGDPDPVGATFPGANGRIAYVGPHGIYVTGSKGHGKVKHLAGRGRTKPQWSSDGRRIAFERYDEHGSDIYKMRANGRHKVLLTTGGRSGFGPTWSPNGNRIAFVRDFSGPNGTTSSAIYKMRPNGADKRRVTPKNGPAALQATWSPTGERIAYACWFRHRDGEICSIRPDGSGFRVLTDMARRSALSPDYSPDGRRIAFDARRGGNIDIYTMDADGGHLRRITKKKDHWEALPTWSPDGSKIAFVQFGERGGIWKMRADGTHKRRIIADGTFPAWQPK